jgi:hypothetical protein
VIDDDRDGAVPRPPEPDVIVFGGSPGERPPWRGRLRWRGPLRWLALPVALAAAAVLAVLAHAGRQAVPDARRSSPPPSSAPATAPSAPTAEPSPSPDVIVTDMGRPLLGVTAGWELFGWGPEGVVRIQLARGSITRTELPPISSSGPMSFVVGRDWAMLRPLDVVQGYLVRDGQPARPLGGTLAHFGPALPGPDQQHVWVPTGNGQRGQLALVDADGNRAGASIAIPVTLNSYAQTDGAGYVLLQGPGGVYDARPDGLRRVTTGTVLAAGPTHWLTYECDERYRCETVVIDRGTGARHTIDMAVVQAYGATGVISPTGTAAALIKIDPTDGTMPASIHLIQLTSGKDRRLAIPTENDMQDGTMAWSPDGRWLFVVAGGTVYAVDAAKGEIHDLGVRLPHLTQLAVRP